MGLPASFSLLKALAIWLILVLSNHVDDSLCLRMHLRRLKLNHHVKYNGFGLYMRRLKFRQYGKYVGKLTPTNNHKLSSRSSHSSSHPYYYSPPYPSNPTTSPITNPPTNTLASSYSPSSTNPLIQPSSPPLIVPKPTSPSISPLNPPLNNPPTNPSSPPLIVTKPISPSISPLSPPKDTPIRAFTPSPSPILSTNPLETPTQVLSIPPTVPFIPIIFANAPSNHPSITPSINPSLIPLSPSPSPLTIPFAPTISPPINPPTIPLSPSQSPLTIPFAPTISPSINPPTIPLSPSPNPLIIPFAPTLSPPINPPTNPLSPSPSPLTIPFAPTLSPPINPPTIPLPPSPSPIISPIIPSIPPIDSLSPSISPANPLPSAPNTSISTAPISPPIPSKPLGLQVGFYKGLCPNINVDVESSIAAKVQEEFQKDASLLAALLRMQFHDCFVHGCDASILIDGPSTEKNAGPNLSVRGYEFIDTLKDVAESECPSVVSCADIIAIATKELIKLGGGPEYLVETGRRDGMISRAEDVKLPSPFGSVSQSISAFAAKKFTTQEMVALFGCHTVGISHCTFFQDRLYRGTRDFDPNMDPNLRRQLIPTCPQGSTSNHLTSLDQNSESSNIFDNSFYDQILKQRGILPIDQALARDANTRGFVQQFATNGALFNSKLVDAMIKLQALDVLTGDQGQIRKVCSKFN